MKYLVWLCVQLRAHLSDLRIRLFSYIVQTLDVGITTTVQLPSTAWARVRNKFLGLFGQGTSSKLKDELCDKLIEVHDDIMAQVSELLFYGTAEPEDEEFDTEE